MDNGMTRNPRKWKNLTFLFTITLEKHGWNAINSFTILNVTGNTFYYIKMQLIWWDILYCICRGGRKVRLIDLPIPIRSSDFIGQYNRLMLSSDFFCIGRLCRFVLSSDSLIDRSCFLDLSSDFCICRLCRPVLSKNRFTDTLFVNKS